MIYDYLQRYIFILYLQGFGTGYGAELTLNPYTMYPIKFKPRLKERIWGGRNLIDSYGKPKPRKSESDARYGESWEICGLDGELSVAANGYLKNNTIQELIEVYMGELVGDRVYDRFGLVFPILIKLIDAETMLSVQVHPNDEMAAQRHGCYGKTEMWYVMDADPEAYLYVGFNRRVSRAEYLEAVENGTLPNLLQRYEARPGDVFFIPAGTVHALGKGIRIAEIQQTSDVTYRIDDWGRTDAEGKPREIHTELALDAIDFTGGKQTHITPVPQTNEAVKIVACPQFAVNLIALHGTVERDLAPLDSFVVYLCTEGSATVNEETLKKGETLLVPAEETTVQLSGEGTLLEVFMP